MKHEHIKLRRPQYYNNLPTHLSPGGNPQNQNQLPGRRLARPGVDRQCLGARPVRHLAEAGTLVQIFTAILTWLSRPVRLRPLTCIYTVEPRGLEPLR
jgi:hypothetical protein